MHEMGIASSILEAVEKECLLHPGHRAVKVGVVIGEYAGVDTESLRFCFEALSKDFKPAPLQLDIAWRVASDQLLFQYLEMEEVSDEHPHEYRDNSNRREESVKRERSRCGTVA